MRHIHFAILGVLIGLPIVAKATPFDAGSCETDKEAFARANKVLAAALKFYKASNIMQHSTFRVGNINGQGNCGEQWIFKVLDKGELSIGAGPLCGILVDTSKETAKALANASQVLFGGTVTELTMSVDVAPGKTETFHVPMCVSAK